MLGIDPAKDAEKREQKFALALSVQPAEADDLALAARSRLIPARRAPQFRFSTSRIGARRAACADFVGIHIFVIAADHQFDDLVAALAALWQNDSTCRPLRKTEQSSANVVISRMRWEMYTIASPSLAKTIEDRVDTLDVRRGERRGRLVQNQELGRASERACDLDHLSA